ncbi:polysaccharide biosynthesis tyrosine autokinase [Mycolicibacterium peregrinum]|uniref:polysaccharide biosynthesis tyrosine autokinase n=1 Tax=Mycolicibacterium peregrinum TaxID=43304 RepID=UPI000A8BC7F6|nr:polysaccharide biosynthesis tyrosine autokinase [Mycolicibacterium peregrinum]
MRESTRDEGSQLTVRDFVRILRTRSKIICGTIVIAVLCALAYALLATPQYEATTRLFVSTASEGPGTEVNNGGMFAERRVLSYTELLTGGILAQRTIDKLGLDMSVPQLLQETTATTPTGTVLIDVTVQDPSPTRARDIANTLSDEFVIMAAGLERPTPTDQPNARVVVQERADIPQAPVSPKKTTAVALAIVLGAVLGIVLAIIRDFLDTTVRRPETVEKTTGVGLVGDIPFDGEHDGPLISFGDDRSSIADSFRELRIGLQFLEVGNSVEKPRVVLVTSSVPGEGRTTTALNLAIALSEADYTVAVVDADLRNPQIGSSLDIGDSNGLATVLTGGAPLREALQDTRFPRLSALTAGAVPSNPTMLLASQAAREVFGELGRQFDYVVIDSPSLQTTDAAILAGSSQGVLMIVRSGRTKRQQLAKAMSTLERAGAPVLGAVLTMSGRRRRGSRQG